MPTCPSCGSSRVRNGYLPAPFPLRVIGIRELLCDNCNLLYRGFSPFPPKQPRRHQSSHKTNPFNQKSQGDLDALKSHKTLHTASAVSLAHKHSMLSSPFPDVSPRLFVNVSSEISEEKFLRDSTAHVCPHCGSKDVKRRRRRLWERVIFSFSSRRPYFCDPCGASFYARSHNSA